MMTGPLRQSGAHAQPYAGRSSIATCSSPQLARGIGYDREDAAHGARRLLRVPRQGPRSASPAARAPLTLNVSRIATALIGR
jgi:hypothetical protein